MDEKQIAFGVVIVMAIIGAFVSGIVIHELIHMYQLRDYVAPGNGTIYVLEIPNSIDSFWKVNTFGTYEFKINPGTEAEVDKIHNSSETIDYLIQGVILFFVIKSIVNVYFDRK